MLPRNITAKLAAFLAVFPAIAMATTLPAARIRRAEPTVKLDGGLINISGEQGGGYPRAIVTKDGTLLASYRDPRNGIVVRPSHDEGASWDDPATVLAHQPNTDETNAYLYQKISGDILCAYRRHIHNESNSKQIIQLNLDVSQSKDGGKSWSVLSSILSKTPSRSLKGAWEPFLREDTEGKLEVYWAQELNGSDQDTAKKVSPDGGKTWGKIQTMTGAGLNQRDGMANIVALDDTGKHLLMVYETNEKTLHLKVWAQTSSDGGASWGDRRIIFDPEKTNPGRTAGGPGIVNVNGTLVVSFMTNQDSPTGHNYPSEGTGMKVITSTNQGKDWSTATAVMKVGSWGGITTVGDFILVLAAHEGKAFGQKIKLVD